MDLLRKPVFMLALVLILIVVLIEVGGVELLRRPAGQVASFGQMLSGREDLRDALDELDQGELQAVLSQPKPPGRAIRYMALLDGMLLFTVALMGLSLVISHRVQGRVQGIATLIFSLLLILGAIAMIIAALLALLLMVALFLAVPFGTLAYLAIYGFFNRPGASVILSLLMALKIGFAVSLVVAQQRFLQNKGLVLMILTSLLANVVVSFLHGLVPIFLVSITDDVAAIVVGILAAIWAIVLLISSLFSTVKALRFDRA